MKIRIAGFVHAALLASVVCSLAGPPQAGGTLPGPLPLFPRHNWWNTDVSAAPVDPRSASFISFINNGGSRRLHPDLGGDVSPGSVATYGFPFVVVDGTQARKAVQFYYPDESDGVDPATGLGYPFYPIPDEAITQAHWIEGGDPGDVDLRDQQDRHLLIVDRDNHYLYELYNVYYDGANWQAGSGARFDLTRSDRRPDRWTSADAAGLAILPGLIRYDEVFGAGEIEHALRVTVRASNGYVFPASHAAGSNPSALPMGARLRLKAAVDISRFPAEAQKIFRAMKRYGLIVADNGTDMYISGTYDTRWNSDVLNPAFSGLTASDFEVVQLGWQPPVTISRYFAEGATNAFFNCRFALANPTTSPANVLLRFLKRDGSTVTQAIAIPASGRRTLDVKTVPGMAVAEFSTIVESDVPVVADRTMSWDASGYGAHAETSIPAPSTEWYLAEGATHTGFSLYYLMQNPGLTDALIDVTYLRPAPAPPLVRRYTVPAHSRYNLYVNGTDPGLARTDVSAIIRSVNGVPVIVERAMYRDVGGLSFKAGTDAAAVTSPSTHWLLAEGATGAYFSLYVLAANPAAEPAQLTVSYLLPSGTRIVRPHTVQPLSRLTIFVANEDTRLAATSVSIQVDSTVPVVVERAMWWPGPTPATWIEGHASAGTTMTGTAWALAEGERGGPRNADTYVLVANTSPYIGAAKVTLLFEDGTVSERTFALAPTSRFNVHPGDVQQVPEAAGRRFAVVVESQGLPPAEIVVERAMYFDANGVSWSAGTCALATRIR
jgi:hypothetical protein